MQCKGCGLEAMIADKKLCFEGTKAPIQGRGHFMN